MSGVCSAAVQFLFSLCAFSLSFYICGKCGAITTIRREDCYAAGDCCFSGFKRGSHFASSHGYRFNFVVSFLLLIHSISLAFSKRACGKKQFVSTMHKSISMFIWMCVYACFRSNRSSLFYFSLYSISLVLSGLVFLCLLCLTSRSL